MAVYICIMEENDFKAFFPACQPPLKKEPPRLFVGHDETYVISICECVPKFRSRINTPLHVLCIYHFPFAPPLALFTLHHNYIKTHTFIQTPKKRVSITLIPYLALRDKTRLMKPACTYCMFPLLSWNVMEEYKTLQASI